jgi:glycosyl transferase family 2
MRIHGMCMVKDEADIVEEALTAAAAWCDHIYVFDNGSTDGTWELVQRLADDVPQIVPWKTDPAPFSDGLRAQIFERFRSASDPGDWWCRLDADELYIDDPRTFLRKVPEEHAVVWTASFSYYLTDKDAELYEREPERYADDVPVQEKIRWYVNHWSEPRFFRYSEGIDWSNDGGFPAFVETATPYPVRIWLKHFPYRSPQQIVRRLAARQEAVTRGVFGHEAIADWGQAVGAVRSTRALMERTGVEFATVDWKERIVPATSLDYDAHDGRLAVNEALMPKLPGRATRAERARARLRAVARRVRGMVARP